MALKPESDSGIAKSLRDVGPYLGLGLQLAAIVVVMVLIGSWLDKKFNLNYILTLVFGLVGTAAGIYNLIKTVNELERKSKIRDEKK
ncbi:MAG: AtpZ/AtpI family protein [Ignavibacteriaceae bacterium]|nr:AtpZ/AtpI family protein [Ignavibacterium sp.]MCC6253999.1 AtpZ/AtpI family protein [Ignavibacteriaceae bacterium]HMN24724.1 AtpZ/AtpI family protein [Ignavibacteriaceae bacterium]HRN26906.1 AtpZ/AtpI family protein [Ignavibacteriaceae bacterium]HRP92413.1 AtpZ/AtpI family protein [Ignavibacteriaceae bacterium]